MGHREKRKRERRRLAKRSQEMKQEEYANNSNKPVMATPTTTQGQYTAQ